MSFVLKFKEDIEKKIRYIEEGTTDGIADHDMYVLNVGHKRGLKDAVVLLDQVLGELAEPEDTHEERSEDRITII